MHKKKCVHQETGLCTQWMELYPSMLCDGSEDYHTEWGKSEGEEQNQNKLSYVIYEEV